MPLRVHFVPQRKTRITVIAGTSSAELSQSLSCTALPFICHFFLLSFALSHPFPSPFPPPQPCPPSVSFFLPSFLLSSSSHPLGAFILSARGQVGYQGARAASSACEPQGTKALSERDNLGQLSSVVVSESGRLCACSVGCDGQSPLGAS